MDHETEVAELLRLKIEEEFGPAMDAKGRSCTYVPIRVNGRVVDSKGFTSMPRSERARSKFYW